MYAMHLAMCESISAHHTPTAPISTGYLCPTTHHHRRHDCHRPRSITTTTNHFQPSLPRTTHRPPPITPPQIHAHCSHTSPALLPPTTVTRFTQRLHHRHYPPASPTTTHNHPPPTSTITTTTTHPPSPTATHTHHHHHHHGHPPPPPLPPRRRLSGLA